MQSVQTELIQGDNGESAEAGVFPFSDIDRTDMLVLIIDIRYNGKDCHRWAVAILISLLVDNNSRVPDIYAQKVAGS